MNELGHHGVLSSSPAYKTQVPDRALEDCVVWVLGLEHVYMCTGSGVARRRKVRYIWSIKTRKA